MRPPIRHVALGIVGLMAAACGPSFQARSAVAQPHDYTRDRTYVIRGESDELQGVDRETRERIVPRVRAQIVSQLASRGFERVSNPEQAALIVDFTIEGRVSTMPVGTVAGRPYGGTRLVDGALAILVRDRASDELLWSGYLNEQWIAGGDRIPAVVAAVLQDFPPPPQ